MGATPLDIAQAATATTATLLKWQKERIRLNLDKFVRL
ncbi:hypothetical protein X749_30985 [Mesorhizobium sp. LNJC391B00]|nr:hypothetical protein X749_30985 [Mesorhizobium sp. LNJC391B00]